MLSSFRRAEIDDLYIDRPYYIVPDGEVGQQAFGVIRDAINKKGMVALGRVVPSTREHVIALEARSHHIQRLALLPYRHSKHKEVTAMTGTCVSVGSALIRRVAS